MAPCEIIPGRGNVFETQFETLWRDPTFAEWSQAVTRLSETQQEDGRPLRTCPAMNQLNTDGWRAAPTRSWNDLARRHGDPGALARRRSVCRGALERALPELESPPLRAPLLVHDDLEVLGGATPRKCSTK